MKAVAHAEVRFDITVPSPTLEALYALAGMHYDSTCRAAGAVGGFIYGWHNAAVAASEMGTYEVQILNASFRDLDLVAKICELQTYFKPADKRRTLIAEFNCFVHRLLRSAGEIKQGWPDVEILP